MRKVIFILITCLSMSGCASPRSVPPGYSPGEGKSLPLSHLSGQERAQLYEKIYMEPVTAESDVFAKELTLTALNKAIGTSDLPDDSYLVFNKIDLSKMDYDFLCQQYRILSKLIYAEQVKDNTGPEFIDVRGNQYWSFDAEKINTGEKTEQEAEQVPVLEIIRMTALYSLGNEIERRGSETDFWKKFGSATTRATGIAIGLALTLAKYML